MGRQGGAVLFCYLFAWAYMILEQVMGLRGAVQDVCDSLLSHRISGRSADGHGDPRVGDCLGRRCCFSFSYSVQSEAWQRSAG